jgi:hypothetical protein
MRKDMVSGSLERTRDGRWENAHERQSARRTASKYATTRRMVAVEEKRL